MCDDVQNALEWTVLNCRFYGGDPNEIFVIGHSAGAHLVSLAILRDAISIFT